VTTPPRPDAWTFETITVLTDGAVLFADILAPPINLLGPELVRDLVSLIQRAEADDTYKVLVFGAIAGFAFGPDPATQPPPIPAPEERSAQPGPHPAPSPTTAQASVSAMGFIAQHPKLAP
jgi:hypothetical protein